MDKFSVLIIDHDDSAGKLVRRLEDQGLEVTSVHNYKEAVLLVSNSSFDVCVMEIMLSGIGDGLRALDHIKRMRPLTEVIILTGRPSLESGIRALRSGAYDYLMKPVRFEDLLAKITQAYERKMIEEGK